MRSISCRDILVAEELSHIKNEIELLNPDNDELVKSVLTQVGFDVRHGIQYIPSLHRDMQNKVAVGFMAIGEYNTDPKYKQFMDTFDRVVIAGMQDASLGREMANMMGQQFQFNNDPEADAKEYSEAELKAMGFTSGNEDEYVDDSPEESDRISREIEQLKMICASIRGEN